MNIGKEPFWRNACEHPRGTYVGSVEYEDSRLDVYVYDITHPALGPQSSCVRYGDEKHEYRSPGHPANVLNSKDPDLKMAAAVLKKYGYFKYELHKNGIETDHIYEDGQDCPMPNCEGFLRITPDRDGDEFAECSHCDFMDYQL